MENNNEVMIEDQNVDIVDEVVSDCGKSSILECVGAVGLIAAVGYGAYRGGKALRNKLKERKEAKKKAADQNEAPAETEQTAE